MQTYPQCRSKESWRCRPALRNGLWIGRSRSCPVTASIEQVSTSREFEGKRQAIHRERSTFTYAGSKPCVARPSWSGLRRASGEYQPISSRAVLPTMLVERENSSSMCAHVCRWSGRRARSVRRGWIGSFSAIASLLRIADSERVCTRRWRSVWSFCKSRVLLSAVANALFCRATFFRSCEIEKSLLSPNPSLQRSDSSIGPRKMALTSAASIAATCN